jgi:ribosome-associated protein
VASSTTRETISEARADRALRLALAAARTAWENRGRDIVVLDMRRCTSICDYFVLATGTTPRQLHSMSEEIDHVLEEGMGDRRLGIEGFKESRWILLDYGDVVIHLFDPDARAYYDLEHLWCEAPHVPLDWEASANGKS